MSLETEIPALVAEIANRGVGTDDLPAPLGTPGYVAFDFNSTILGSPYVEGSGFLPDQEETYEWAESVLDRLVALGERAVAEDPSWAASLGWANPLAEARTPYADVVRSAWTEEEADRYYGTEQITPG